MKIAASGIALTLIALSGCDGDMHSQSYRTVSRVSVSEQLDFYSSRVFDATKIRARTGANEGKIPRACPDAKQKETFAVDHFWQLDDVELGEVGAIVSRVRDYLAGEGWRIDRFEVPPSVPSAVVSATNPQDGYVVWAKGIADKNRVAVQVSSPCFKLPNGSA